jgi:hypothetical protein
MKGKDLNPGDVVAVKDGHWYTYKAEIIEAPVRHPLHDSIPAVKRSAKVLMHGLGGRGDRSEERYVPLAAVVSSWDAHQKRQRRARRARDKRLVEEATQRERANVLSSKLLRLVPPLKGTFWTGKQLSIQGLTLDEVETLIDYLENSLKP